MEFDIKFPEMAVLVIIVYHEPDGLKSFLTGAGGSSKIRLAYYSLPVSCIRQGYRIMELYNEIGMRSPMSDLFCRFKIDFLRTETVGPEAVEHANIIY